MVAIAFGGNYLCVWAGLRALFDRGRVAVLPHPPLVLRGQAERRLAAHERRQAHRGPDRLVLVPLPRGLGGQVRVDVVGDHHRAVEGGHFHRQRPDNAAAARPELVLELHRDRVGLPAPQLQLDAPRAQGAVLLEEVEAGPAEVAPVGLHGEDHDRRPREVPVPEWSESKKRSHLR